MAAPLKPTHHKTTAEGYTKRTPTGSLSTTLATNEDAPEDP